jgi:hypothetical protein
LPEQPRGELRLAQAADAQADASEMIGHSARINVALPLEFQDDPQLRPHHVALHDRDAVVLDVGHHQRVVDEHDFGVAYEAQGEIPINTVLQQVIERADLIQHGAGEH